MNSQESTSNNQKNVETRVDGSLKKNGNQPIEQSAKPSKVLQLESKLCRDQLKLNNKLGENTAKNLLSSKPSVALANGIRSPQAATSSFTNSIEQDTNQDMPNAYVSSIFLDTNNIMPRIVNADAASQTEHETATNTSALNLQQMHLNLSSSQSSTHPNHACVSISYNAGEASSPILHLNNSAPVSPAILPNLSATRPNEDIDMKNNVDYVSGIEKCPSKVSCSSDSSPEADCAWASKSDGSKCLLNIGGSIGSTSQGTCCFLTPNINGSREVAGLSGLQKVGFYISLRAGKCNVLRRNLYLPVYQNIQREQSERQDSNSGNEGDLSDGEDYCVYTYKGNDDAVHSARKEEANRGQVEEQDEEGQYNSGRSSPEMDFLEMDFDPGPSCEQVFDLLQ